MAGVRLTYVAYGKPVMMDFGRLNYADNARRNYDKESNNGFLMCVATNKRAFRIWGWTASGWKKV